MEVKNTKAEFNKGDKMSKVWVVTCKTDGCDECPSSYHVVGVFDNEEFAKKMEKDHARAQEKLHRHYSCVDTQEVNLNQVCEKS